MKIETIDLDFGSVRNVDGAPPLQSSRDRDEN
jgi:hypothetical protein